MSEPQPNLEQHNAPVVPLPDTLFYSIQYPGYSASPEKLISTLGGMGAIQKAFSEHPGFLELNYTPGDIFMHPVSGEIISTSNLLLKVVRRTNRRTGECTLEHRIVGAVSKTCRFRALADFQYAVDPEDPLVKLRYKMENLDVGGLDPLPFDEEAKGVGFPLRHIPPPGFSRLEWPVEYGYLENPAVLRRRATKVGVSGDSPRYTYKTARSRKRISFCDFSEETVPTEAPKNVSAPKHLVDVLLELFAQRPIWSRNAILGTVDSTLIRQQHLSTALPVVSYFVLTGPWRSMWVRFGYDPRKERSARLYQTIDMRSVKHPGTARAQRAARNRFGSSSTAGSDSIREGRAVKSHIFDGESKSFSGMFQLCDVTDPSLKIMIGSARYCRDSFSDRDGWLISGHIDEIRTAISKKLRAIHSLSKTEPKARSSFRNQRIKDVISGLTTFGKSSDDEGSGDSANSASESAKELECGDHSSAESAASTSISRKGVHLSVPPASDLVRSKVDELMNNLRLAQKSSRGAITGMGMDREYDTELPSRRAQNSGEATGEMSMPDDDDGLDDEFDATISDCDGDEEDDFYDILEEDDDDDDDDDENQG
ncbi:hypothetical protein BASA82_001225 [Batrachochytrium salamandrivorans]|uniref:Transcription factor IIIC subunit 5 HTH domain-containing protein n=1 Tax=Batrachochytrium salamandrivorans TaxID=1357716 RepID=A0ABQ8F798_9FUNG|nr:hypothetical protein BASA60_010427 [Batrachochytrium salamandrivorans]KAH6576692.1 hypothetical protein BASA62_001284 [Batrachochytrium salamandrivorans]KAH6593434.1 hypothetical protein BASA50_007385 [Batrachochytrium salamandrivorans]KAH9259841.1 hypothetical protein BASA82_001225 [Batrachochytrium salamandrivorans]